jgi:hypothetical protein
MKKENNNAKEPKVYREVIFPGVEKNKIANQYDIILVTGDGRYKDIFLKSGRPRKEAVTMGYIMGQPDPAVFLPAHRSNIINILCVRTFKPDKKRLHVKMTDGSDAFVCEKIIPKFLEMVDAWH